MVTVESPAESPLVRQLRERFNDEVARLIGALYDRVAEALRAPGAKKPGVDRYQIMDAEAALLRSGRAWTEAAQRAWRATGQAGSTGKTAFGSLSATGGAAAGLTLLDDDAMERTVVSGRLAAAIADQAAEALGQLRIRVRNLEQRDAPVSGDVFRPETFARALVDAWADCGLTLAQWTLAQSAIHQHAANGLRQAYEHANAFLIEHGVARQIDLRPLVRRAPSNAAGSGRLPVGAGGLDSGASVLATSRSSDLYATGLGNEPGYTMPLPSGGLAYAPPGSVGRAEYEGALHGGGVAARGPVMMDGDASARNASGAGIVVSPSAWANLAPALVEQQQRAQDVLGRLRTLATQYVGTAFAAGVTQPVSPVLAQALTGPAPALTEPAPASFPKTEYLPRERQNSAEEKEVGPAEIDQAAGALRDEAEALKDKAERADEKAIIEIVSLMFQSILTDERMPSALRVWFARLQLPVLRLALAEPEFFAATDHPARRLIDRMGACAMGLDDVKVDGGRLEQEVKRIVQVIEQYPETGKKAFQLVLSEFEKFLGSALAEGKPAQQFATLAQQIEQKDALAIQYTIELRKMLSAVPVSNDVREFLFRVWSEVLALAVVRRGAQDAETMRFKQAAADLLWAVSPKADRAERRQVTQYLPGILQTLRAGMTLLAMSEDEQDSHIRLLNQAVVHAFNTPAQGITPAQMNTLARALTGLEDVVTDDPEGDLLLDPALLEQILGEESANLHVIAAGGAQPDAGALQWARELQYGQWFTLHGQGAATRVQYVWRSAHGQLHLFAAASGASYLIQTRRLASYLQAGLLAPLEEESLTIHATRDALDKLNRAPERLLR
ncbi:MAG: DUF1631 domain-containing protein [Burkholderiaceae bacterium]|jgi:hypothetical protein|nr:DUF1631 domain-containing protein [Burkholderiaceae bacterium]